MNRRELLRMTAAGAAVAVLPWAATAKTEVATSLWEYDFTANPWTCVGQVKLRVVEDRIEWQEIPGTKNRWGQLQWSYYDDDDDDDDDDANRTAVGL